MPKNQFESMTQKKEKDKRADTQGYTDWNLGNL